MHHLRLFWDMIIGRHFEVSHILKNYFSIIKKCRATLSSKYFFFYLSSHYRYIILNIFQLIEQFIQLEFQQTQVHYLNSTL